MILKNQGMNNKVFAGNVDDLRVWGRQSWQRKNGNLYYIDIMGKERPMNTGAQCL